MENTTKKIILDAKQAILNHVLEVSRYHFGNYVNHYESNEISREFYYELALQDTDRLIQMLELFISMKYITPEEFEIEKEDVKKLKKGIRNYYRDILSSMELIQKSLKGN